MICRDILRGFEREYWNNVFLLVQHCSHSSFVMKMITLREHAFTNFFLNHLISLFWYSWTELQNSINISADLGPKSFLSNYSRIWRANSSSCFWILTFRMLCRGKSLLCLLGFGILKGQLTLWCCGRRLRCTLSRCWPPCATILRPMLQSRTAFLMFFVNFFDVWNSKLPA